MKDLDIYPASLHLKLPPGRVSSITNPIGSPIQWIERPRCPVKQTGLLHGFDERVQFTPKAFHRAFDPFRDLALDLGQRAATKNYTLQIQDRMLKGAIEQMLPEAMGMFSPGDHG